MVVEVAGIQIQETHAAVAGLVALALVLGAFLLPGGKKPAGKKKGDSEKKKKAPVSSEKKKASKPKAKEEPKPKVEEKKPEPEPVEVVAKVGKKAKARAAEEQAKADADDGWTVSVDKASKKKKDREAEKKAQAPVFANNKPIPGMAAEEPKKGKGKPAVNQGVATDYRKAALENPQDEAKEQKAEDPKEKIPLPKEKIGILVGPKGAMINLLKEKTGVTGIDTQGGFVTISGPPPAVALCVKQVKDLLSKGYCELQFENFSEVFVQAFPSSFPELIGQKGAVVRQIKEQLGVEVQFPQTEPKGFGKGLPEKKLKIAIAGPKDKVAEAKAAMSDILEHHHSELTHPGEIHEEVDVESWLYSFIIGTRGSELKHIQQNFKVRVFIPRGEYEAPVLVVGLPANVERAVKYIKKVVEQAKNRPTGSGRGGDAGYADMDGAEGEDYEPWMDEFMYKRK